MADLHILGLRMRKRREQLGWTLAALAEESNVSVPYLANIENGRGNPTFNVLDRVATALATPLHDLVQSPGHAEEVIANESLRLATQPESLKAYSRSKQFKVRVQHLADEQNTPYAEVRSALLEGLAAAPVQLKDSDFVARDWDRLLDAYVLTLRGV